MNSLFTCPMHPEVQQDHPGNCPICGMTLEPQMPAPGTDEAENAALTDMKRRFWIGVILTVPVFALAMMHIIPGLENQTWTYSYIVRWLQFILTIPVVWWAGWPFFVRGWQSVIMWNLNMFTLIAIGVGTAFGYSAVAMLAPDLFPPAMRQWHLWTTRS